MKKLFKVLIVALLSVSLIACSSGEKSAAGDREGLSAILVVNGNLGDLGFFDSANEGMNRAKNELGIDIKVIETGAEEDKWEPALADAAEEDVDVIIAVSPSMIEAIERIAPQYPDKKFFLIDNAVDYEKGDLDNVYSATFKQNEGSFLAGALAAHMTTELPNADDDKVVGFIGGMDIPPINDFLVGYIQGAQYVDPEVKVMASYTGDYYDAAKGKELGLVLINNKADVIFPAAGPAALGTIEAALEKERYIIGVDNDQSSLYAANGDQASADIIISSMMKNVGDVVYRGLELLQKGELKFGEVEKLGIEEGGVGLAKNEVFKKSLTPETIEALEAIEKDVISGKIEVKSAIGMSQAELDELRNSVKP